MIMPNTLREKLDQGKSTLGTRFFSSDPDLPELLGDTGLYDYGEFCAEYSAFDMQLLYHMARSGQCGNLPMMIKPDQKSQAFWAQAALGAGFKAVLFTDIRTPEDIHLCHEAIRPDTPEIRGHMGVKLRRPALAGYQTDGYLEDLNSVVFAIMIEKTVALDNIDEILSTAKEKGVDMTQWGPVDFSFSRGTPALMQTPEIRPFEEQVIKKSLEHGVAPRIELSSVEQAKRYIDLGVRHFNMGVDRNIYRTNIMTLGEGMRKLTENI